MKRFFQFLTAILPILAAEILQNVLYSVILFVNGNAEVSNELLYLYSAGIILVCGIVFFFWYRIEIRGEARGSLRNIISFRTAPFILLLGISSQFFFTGLMTLVKPFFTDAFSDYAEVMQTLTSGNEVVVLILAIIIAPVTEELIFRGVTLHIANRYITFLGANLLQAVLFGIYHWNVIQGVYASFLGFLLGAVYYKYKSIFAPILLHMSINASSLLTFLLPDRLISYIIATAVGGILIVVMLLIIKPSRTVQIVDNRMP